MSAQVIRLADRRQPRRAEPPLPAVAEGLLWLAFWERLARANCSATAMWWRVMTGGRA